MTTCSFSWRALLLLGAVASATWMTPSGALAAGRADYCGIWGIWGGHDLSSQGRLWYKGTMVVSRWEIIEPENGRFDWKPLDGHVKQAVDNGLYVMVKVYAGNNSPLWLRDHGVPWVETNSPDPGRQRYPFYLDDDFKSYFTRMIQSVAEHINSYPAPIRKRIIGIQCPLGKSGDENAYHGQPLDQRYRIDEAQWLAYEKEMCAVYCEAYKNADPPIVCLFNASATIKRPALHEWLLKKYPNTWRKFSWANHSYQVNTEADGVELIRNATTRLHDGVPILARDEWSMQSRGWYKEAPVWNVYWVCLRSLFLGMDFFNIPGSRVIKDTESHSLPALMFYDRYVGYHDPRDSSGAWCALRDGLDCADVERFSEEKFGGLERGRNPQRYLNIAAAHSAYGAAQGDNSILNQGYVIDLQAKKMNDVGWRIYTGNLHVYLYQHDPNGTSRGHWRVGSKEQPYGRFARGFDAAAGKNAMVFKIDDGFFFDKPLNGEYPVQVRVVYFDSGSGKWALKYDAVGDPQKTAYVLEKTDSGQWKEQTITITDGYFGHRCSNSTDLMLVNTDDEDDLFHMIELTRQMGFRQP